MMPPKKPPGTPEPKKEGDDSFWVYLLELASLIFLLYLLKKLF